MIEMQAKTANPSIREPTQNIQVKFIEREKSVWAKKETERTRKYKDRGEIKLKQVGREQCSRWNGVLSGTDGAGENTAVLIPFQVMKSDEPYIYVAKVL